MPEPANPTPSLAGTAETMTSDDAELIDAHANGANVWITRALGCRILATYHALAASQQDVERLRQENMALGTENRMLWGDVERLRASAIAALSSEGK